VFIYDDWNLIEERIAYTTGMTSTIHYYWGKDLSGSFQGAGGVGGIVGVTIGTSSTEMVYDWIFTPLEKEEWEICCEL
jgi:hypothetical protein